MKLTIDNLDGYGVRDYTALLDAAQKPKVVRKLNRPAELHFGLVTKDGNFVVPVPRARVMLGRTNGSDVFAGYISETPTYEFMGWSDRGPVYRYEVVALSDEAQLDMKAPSASPPFVARSAGNALRQLSQEMWPDWGDLSGVQDGDMIPYYATSTAKKWSETAAEIALLARSAYRSEAGKLLLSPLGQRTYGLSETAAEFSPGDLRLRGQERVVNDLAVYGQVEPSARVKDYFVGDGYTTKFYLSQIPFTRGHRTILDEEYLELAPYRWAVTDPNNAISIVGGKLQVAGGTGADGATRLEFIESVELGGAVVLEHGNFAFSAASNGVIGGLYAGAVSVAGCWAGFRITPAGANSQIAALIRGAVTGAPLTTQSGHRYVLTTAVYATEMFRMGQVFHSAGHPAGAARGGQIIASDARVVLEVHDIDPANPASLAAPAVVLYDGVLTAAPGFCTYALINAATMQCSAAFTRISLIVDALVRSTLPEQTTRTRRTGALLDGAECRVSEEPGLQFYAAYAPAANETIEVSYRGRGRARARVKDPVSVVAHRLGSDDGVRGGVRQIKMPAPRTSVDCETAALALLEDSGQAWEGEYKVWSPFLPDGATDIFPGDGLAVNVPSRVAAFASIVREIEIEVADLLGENCRYTLRFTDAKNPSLGFDFENATSLAATNLIAMDIDAIETAYVPDLANAAVTATSSTSVTIDAGYTPGASEGIEVRRTDAGWGTGNDRNLVGRFTSRSFAAARYGRAQDYFLRRYDNSMPPKYSRYSAALHVDYPL